MLSKIIVSSYELLIEISLWLFLLISVIVGWKIGDGLLGAIGGLIMGFVVSVMFFGALPIFRDMEWG